MPRMAVTTEQRTKNRKMTMMLMTKWTVIRARRPLKQRLPPTDPDTFSRVGVVQTGRHKLTKNSTKMQVVNVALSASERYSRST